MFLEEWIDRTELVVDSPSIQVFKKWYDDHINEEVDDNSSLSLSYYLKSFECKSKDKIQFFDEYANKIEKDIEVLQVQIQSYSLQDHDHSFQNISMPEHKERMLLPISFEF